MRVHFIAIGGSAMHNLAIALKLKGFQVSGSDDEIFEPSRSRLKKYDLLPESTGWFPEKIHSGIDAIILGMHARADNPELEMARQLGLKIYSYPEFLYEQAANKKRVVIGGSHGKTTITSMILHVLNYAGIETDYMVGAQLDGFEVMVRLSESASWFVMEGDEYLTSPIDRRPKFLLYRPHIAVISGIAWDHINVFPQFEDYVHQFELFTQTIEPGGKLIFYTDDDSVRSVAEKFTGEKMAYGVHPYKVMDDATFLIKPDKNLLKLQVFGSHNMANLKAARLVCQSMGVDETQFYEAIGSFGGASRRLELIVDKPGLKIYRDFAHAPSKVKASVEAIREQYPESSLIACLELHTFSSLSDGFLNHYRHTLNRADVAAVFYDPHAIALKRLPDLGIDRIKEAFGYDGLMVFNKADQLGDFLEDSIKQQTVMLLMSSGSFNGLDVSRF